LQKSFYRRAYFEEWHRFTGLCMKVRGDGRNYLICLNTPGQFDVVWHDQFHYPLFTHGGPYWQFVKVSLR
jgi:NADH dehydrogenase [ubiquinone] 1 alpha subcomplex assembly factor 1